MEANSRIIPIELLQTFVCVAELKSVSKAAGYLRITQPAVSLRIKKLATMLNADLFVWRNGSFSMTADGMEFYPVAKKVVDSYFDAMSGLKLNSGS
jgi:LysR family carnitine catabolism transcriptional activator